MKTIGYPKPTKVSAKGRRQKGARLERTFAKLLRQYELDEKASRQVLSGGSWTAPTDIFTTLPYAFECKNQERLNFWDSWEQAKASEQPFSPAVLVHTANHRPIMVSMEVETFLNLLKEVKDLQIYQKEVQK